MTRRSLFLTFGAGWVALVLMRIVMNSVGSEGKASLFQLATVVTSVSSFWIPIVLIVLAIDRSRRLQRAAPLIGVHVAVAIVVALVEPRWLMFVRDMAGMKQMGYLQVVVGRIDINVLLYAVIVAGDIAILRLRAFRAREVAAARLEQTLIDTQLHALAIQLQPHFLFNALQFVAETAHEDLAAARRTLGQLRALVEQAFALETRLEVTVAEELSFLRAYGEIQRSRFGDRFSLSIVADDASMGASIPPLLLQPLVENASRHGFAKRGSGGHIEVMLRARNDILSIVVADDGVGLAANIVEGQGLSVTRRRLHRLHGKEAHLSLARAADGRTETRIRMPLRTPDPVRTADMTLAPSSDVEHPAEEGSMIGRVTERVPLVGRVFIIWTALLTLAISATWAATQLGSLWPDAEPGLESIMLDEMVGLPFWILLTAAALYGSRRLSGRWAIPVHATLAIAVAVAHASFADDIARGLFHAKAGYLRYITWGVWDVLVYAALVLMARAHELREWATEKMREEISLNHQVVKATNRLNRLRETQALLLNALDEVISSPTMETLDRSVVDFADFLRGEVMADVVGAGAAD